MDLPFVHEFTLKRSVKRKSRWNQKKKNPPRKIKLTSGGQLAMSSVFSTFSRSPGKINIRDVLLISRKTLFKKASTFFSLRGALFKKASTFFSLRGALAGSEKPVKRYVLTPPPNDVDPPPMRA